MIISKTFNERSLTAKKNYGALIGTLLIAAFFNSCMLSDFEDQKDKTPDTFDYTTTSATSVSVSVKDMKDQSVQGVVVEVYKNHPYDEAGQLKDSISPLTKILTDANGLAESIIDLPTYLTEVYVVVNYPGYANPDTLAVASNVLTAVIHPAGYGLSNGTLASGKLRMASAVAIGPEEYRISGYSNVWKLGAFNSSGLPSYLVERDVISNTLKANIAASFPESYRIPKEHPEFLADANKSNLQLIDNCEIWVTFVTEGAGYRNTLGYFYYPTGSAPETIAAIKTKVIVFPNASFNGSGGMLTEGDKVKLKYYDETNKVWSDVFPKGLTVSWFLIADGFGNNGIGAAGQYWDYSIPAFNAGKYQQNVILYDKAEEKMVIGFEDIRRTSGSDEDFNDAVFYASANPVTAIATDKLNEIIVTKDKDDDGVPDVSDEYPEDPERAFNKYYPGKDSWGMLAFEDLWPKKGDYDFNDFVTHYQFQVVTNANNKVVDVISNFKIMAAGAVNVNGFAFQMGTESYNVKSVTGFESLSGFFKLNDNGTEYDQSMAVIPVIDDVKKLFGGLSVINTNLAGNTKDPVSLSATVHLINPVSESTLGLPPYNPFLIAGFDQDRGKEIHLSGMTPTDLVNTNYFGTDEDLSSEKEGKYYVGDQGYPWALKLPESTPYPLEKVKISSAYLMFTAWVKSSGKNFADWYVNKSGYRQKDKLYLK